MGIIDVDLLGRQKHRFPNLACEKIAGYWVNNGAEVSLITTPEQLDGLDRIYISKVFTDTPEPEWVEKIKNNDNVFIGGTGFYFDKAPNLDSDIESTLPYYSLYDEWISEKINEGHSEKEFKSYTDYSIGFLTRGCFRKCKFCVNQKYDHVFKNNDLDDFYDKSRKKICLLDDNFLAYPGWESLLSQVVNTKKPYKFIQGLDARLLTPKKCELLFSSNYDGDFIFAFDNIKDYDLIKTKLEMMRKYQIKRNIKFYVLTGFDSVDEVDIENLLKRIALLMRYQCKPYVMRFQNKDYKPYEKSRFRDLYISIARWTNQPQFYWKCSFSEFCEICQRAIKTEGFECAPMRAKKNFEKEFPDIANKYFNLKYGDFIKR